MLNIGSNFITEQYKVLQSNPSAYRWFNEGKPEDWVKVAVNKLFVRLFPNACCAEIPDIKSIKVTYYEVIYNNSIYYVNMDEYGNVQLVENMEYTDVFPYSVNGNTYNLKELHNKIEREIKDKDGAEVKFYVMDINVKWWKERLQVAKTVSSLLNEYVAKVNSGVKMSVNDKYSHIAITSLTKAINESEAHEVYLVSRVTGNMDCFRIPNKDNGKVLRGVYYSSLNNYKQPSETMSVNSAIKYTSLGQAIEMRNKFVSGITVNRATSTPFVYRVRLKD
jgi:RNase H-fold protein (predicted Holliday junction resolvase)